MLRKVRVRNFKLHADTEIAFAPVTIFIGPNNSGKSSIFQALLSLRQAASRGDASLFRPASPNQIVDVGDFDDVVRAGQNEISIGVDGSIEDDGNLMDLDFEVHVRNNVLTFHTGRMKLFGRTWDWQCLPLPSNSATIQIPYDSAVIRTLPHPSFTLLSPAGIDFPPSFPPQRQLDVKRIADEISRAPVTFLGLLHPIYPLRGFEEWGYPLPDASEDNLERQTLADRARATVSILAYKPEVVDRLSLWLEDLLQVRLKIKLLTGKESSS